MKRRRIDVKTLMMTGYTSREDFQSLQELEITGCLDKPIGVDRLSKSIGDALAHRS